MSFFVAEQHKIDRFFWIAGTSHRGGKLIWDSNQQLIHYQNFKKPPSNSTQCNTLDTNFYEWQVEDCGERGLVPITHKAICEPVFSLSGNKISREKETPTEEPVEG